MAVDKYGVDPLRSPVFRKIADIKDYQLLPIDESIEGNPWLIAHRHLGFQDLWFVILYYNGLVHHTEIQKGMEIKIPSKPQVLKAMMDKKKKSGTKRIATI